MPKSLITEWKRVGRSGPTVDGRNIEPVALQQAAKNYDKGLFTALIWPDHLRFFNLGTVEGLRTADNGEGGVDLFAKIAPNDIYLNTNKAGQQLFTSMELMPNFRDTGEYYLTGLAATDTPASAATSEMRFSAVHDSQALLSVFVEQTDGHFDDEQEPGWFRRFAEKFGSGKETSADSYGENLGKTLNRIIDAKVNDRTSRASIIARMASAAGISSSTVQQILSGKIVCPPLDRLSGFARALRVPVSRLRSAAERDGCVYATDGGISSCGIDPALYFSSSHATEDDMDKETLKKLTEQFADMQAQLDALSPGGGDEADPSAQDFATLSTKVDQLLEKFAALEGENQKPAVSEEQFTTLMEQFKKLQADFTAAVGEQKGTEAGEHTGDEFNPEDYV